MQRFGRLLARAADDYIRQSNEAPGQPEETSFRQKEPENSAWTLDRDNHAGYNEIASQEGGISMELKPKKNRRRQRNIAADEKLRQLGGSDEISNLWLLDRSVNRSLGKQIERAIREYPYGT